MQSLLYMCMKPEWNHFIIIIMYTTMTVSNKFLNNVTICLHTTLQQSHVNYSILCDTPNQVKSLSILFQWCNNYLMFNNYTKLCVRLSIELCKVISDIVESYFTLLTWNMEIITTVTLAVTLTSGTIPDHIHLVWTNVISIRYINFILFKFCNLFR